MSDKFDEKIAKAFHDNYELLAPRYDYKTRKASAVKWENVPDNNKALMIDVCSRVKDIIWQASREQTVKEVVEHLEKQINIYENITDAGCFQVAIDEIKKRFLK